jgi:cysteine desulfurase / selenocysteine lyase
VTGSGQSAGRAPEDMKYTPLDEGSPLDVATLTSIANRIFNEAIDRRVRGVEEPGPAVGADVEIPRAVGDATQSRIEGAPPGRSPSSLARADGEAMAPWAQLAPDFYFLERPGTVSEAPFPTLPRAERAREPGPSKPGYYFVENGPAAPTWAGPTDAFFDVERVRRDFPILSETVNGNRLVWLDNAATTQKPQAVIDRLARYYSHENSNVHRAAHELAARSTDAYESARDAVARFLGGSSGKEVVFVRGTTEAINLVASSWGARNLAEGDEILISHLEHHANIVPWQQVASRKGAQLKVIPVDEDGQLIMEEYVRLLGPKTRLVAVAHVSNVLGTVVPVAEVVRMAKTVGARVLIDGAQSVAHMRVDLQQMGPDFFVFSGHKIFGPTGIGALWGKPEVLSEMPPWQGGGNMIRDVTFERSTFQDPPQRFEAGTPNIADAVGLGTALDYLEQLGIENVDRYEDELLRYAVESLGHIPGLRLIGTAPDKASVLSFVLKGTRPEDVARALNEQGIAVRAGHHCAQPILRRFGLESTVRASLALYNTHDEVDQLVSVLGTLARRGG